MQRWTSLYEMGEQVISLQMEMYPSHLLWETELGGFRGVSLSSPNHTAEGLCHIYSHRYSYPT